MSIVPSTLLTSTFSTNIVPYIILMILLFIVGLLVTTVNITIMTIFTQIVPLEAMGRTSSVLMLASTILIPLGQISFGFLFDNIAASYVTIICGLILVTAVLVYRKRLLNIITSTEKRKEHEVSLQT